MKNYMNIADIDDLPTLLEDMAELKKENNYPDLGKGKTLGLLFFNPSLRTRMSTEKAARLLGMDVMLINVGSDGWALEFGDGIVMDSGKAEHVREAAAVVSQYCDIIGVRAFPELKDREEDQAERVLEGFRKYAGVPVVNLESATAHPLQALADALTITELMTTRKPKVVLTWAPHPKALPQAVPNSFVKMMQRMEVDLMITNPEGYDLDPEITRGTPVVHDQEAALQDADFVYVKNWSSFQEYGHILSEDPSWMFTLEKLNLTRNARVMHCLPVRRNVVIADQVLDSQSSVVIQQAGNRTFAAQAILKKLLGS